VVFSGEEALDAGGVKKVVLLFHVM